MALVRSKDRDVVVRHAGRRLRITKEWSDVSDDALPRVLSEGMEMVEVKSAPTIVKREAADPAEPSKKSKRGRKSDDATEEAPSGEEKE